MNLMNAFKLSVLASAITLTACGTDDNTSNAPISAQPTIVFASNLNTNIDGKEVWALNDSLTANLATDGVITLTSDKVWQLNGPVLVGDDRANAITLNIEAGTKIVGDEGSYLVISRDSKIDAQGSKDAPIVFTSLASQVTGQGARGQWGGLVILGNDYTNACSVNLEAAAADCEAAFEIGEYQYGGNVSDDNSGTLDYVRVEFGGFKVNDTQEMNGISFAGVGSGTQISNIQVHQNGDDGVEFWGGSVSIRNVVLTENFDDSLDWTNGWNGSAQNVLIIHEDGNANRGIEGDNWSKNNDASPRAIPTLANFSIFVGEGKQDNGAGDDAEGIIIRAGSGANMYNFLVKGKANSGECFEIDSDATTALVGTENLTISHSIIDCSEPFKNGSDALFTEANNNQTVDVTDALNGYQPKADTVLLTFGNDALGTADSRLAQAPYIGAFDGQNDWTAGWTTGVDVQAWTK